jgi:hypothetical protein
MCLEGFVLSCLIFQVLSEGTTLIIPLVRISITQVAYLLASLAKETRRNGRTPARARSVSRVETFVWHCP